MARVRWIAVVVLAMAFVGVGCGSDSGDDSSGSRGGSSTSTSASSGGGGGGSVGGSGDGGAVKISETEFKLDPATAKVDKAGKVTFSVVNDGQTTHALEVGGPGGEAETDRIDPGKSAKLTVDLSKAGTYEIYCPIGNHKAMGMVGKVVVAGGGSGKAESDGDDKGGGGNGGY